MITSPDGRQSRECLPTIVEPPIQHQSRRVLPSKKQACIAFLVLLTINVLNYADRSVLSAVQPFIKSDFRLTDTELGWLNSSFLLIYGLMTLPIGIWADRGTRKNIVAICVSVWSVATTLSGFTQTFAQLFITRAFLGIGEAGYAPASLSLIGDYFPQEMRGRMLSLWSTGNLFGTAIGLAIGGLIADTLGWRWVFYIVGLPGLLAAFCIWRAIEPQRGAFDREEQKGQDINISHGSLGKGFLTAVRKLLKTPTYWVLVGAFICSFFIIGAALSWVPTYLIRAFHLKAGKAGIIAAASLAGGSLFGTLCGGWLADTLQRRFPQGRMTVATLSFLLGSPLCWLALSIHRLPAFLSIFTIAIFCLSLSLGPIQAIIQDISTPDIRSTAIGLALLLGHLLGDAASPIIVGWISDASHSLGFALRITAPTCLLLAGLICLIGIKTVATDLRTIQKNSQDTQ